MTLTFKIGSLQVEGSVSVMPEVIHDSATFAPSRGPMPSPNKGEGAMPASECESQSGYHRRMIIEHVDGVKSSDTLSAILQLFQLLKQLGLIK